MTDPLQEDNITERLMMKCGIESVRGGSYSSVILSVQTITSLRRKFFTAENRCYICGAHDHYANRCPNKKRARDR